MLLKQKAVSNVPGCSIAMMSRQLERKQMETRHGYRTMESSDRRLFRLLLPDFIERYSFFL